MKCYKCHVSFIPGKRRSLLQSYKSPSWKLRPSADIDLKSFWNSLSPVMFAASVLKLVWNLIWATTFSIKNILFTLSTFGSSNEYSSTSFSCKLSTQKQQNVFDRIRNLISNKIMCQLLTECRRKNESKQSQEGLKKANGHLAMRPLDTASKTPTFWVGPQEPSGGAWTGSRCFSESVCLRVSDRIYSFYYKLNQC